MYAHIFAIQCAMGNFFKYRMGYVLVVVTSVIMAITVWQYYGHKVKMLDDQLRTEAPQ